MLSKHRGIKLKMNNSKITGKSPRTQKLNNTLLNNTGLKKKRSHLKKPGKEVQEKLKASRKKKIIIQKQI